jgi:transposase
MRVMASATRQSVLSRRRHAQAGFGGRVLTPTAPGDSTTGTAPLNATPHAVRDAEICRLTLALRQARRGLDANRKQLLAIVDDMVPGLTSRYGVGPVTAAQAVVSFSDPGRCRNEAAFAALSGTSPIPPAAAGPSGTGSTAAVTGR